MLELITVVMRCQRERQVNSVFVILTVRVFVGFRRLCSGFFFLFSLSHFWLRTVTSVMFVWVIFNFSLTISLVGRWYFG